MTAALTKEQVVHFLEQGFLIVEAVLDDDDLAPLWTEYTELLDPAHWAKLCSDARSRILSGQYNGPVFEQARWES